MNIPGATVALLMGLSAPAWALDEAELLSSFEIDPRLQISLFAAEPSVVDPVALTFDEQGRMYVVEMRDYPYGFGPERKPGGTVRLLEDTDGDGKADKSTVFAKDLSFPTSIAPWNGGVFVTAPPEIVYLKDTDGDGVADRRETAYSGFVLGVTDSNLNGLRWGLDNRLHGSNGGNGGKVKSGKGGGVVTELGNADFSFDPSTGELLPTYQTSAGFGLAIDEFGRSFSTYNIDHVQQRIFSLSVLNRHPAMFPVEATTSISDHEDMARIFPISVAQTRPNHPEQAGHFSSAGGISYIGYDVYPADIGGSLVVGDVVANLMHRDVLRKEGPVFRAGRSEMEETREFIASKDGSARFTGLELGPDGALYLIDMQRDVIEHPDYIPEKMRKEIDIRAGEDRGRIYRIVPKSGLPRETRSLADPSGEELVRELEHHNQVRRQTAQRLLVERKPEEAAEYLRKLLRSTKYAPARAHALWTLHGLGALTQADILGGLEDESAGVRENALQLAAIHASPSKKLVERMVALRRDPDARVRVELASALGGKEDPHVGAALLDIARQDRSHWTRAAVLAAMRDPAALLDRAWTMAGEDQFYPEFLEEFCNVAVARASAPGRVLEQLLARVGSSERMELSRAALEGMQAAAERSGRIEAGAKVFEMLARIEEQKPELLLPAWKLARALNAPVTKTERAALAAALRTVETGEADREEKLAALETLRLGSQRETGAGVFALLENGSDGELQSKALEVIRRFREPETAVRLVQAWPNLAPAVRIPVLNFLLSRKEFHGALVTAIEQENLKLGELNLDLEQRRTLLRESTPEIQERVAKFIGDEEYSNRKSIVDEWMAKLPAKGDARAGIPAFEKLCAQCHRVGNIGHPVGPDLTSISHRSVEDILSNILDPNMAINPKYVTFQVETREGDALSGILDQETPQSITLLQALDMRTPVPRREIIRMRSTGLSLMPEGLESGFTPQEMRDLIAFLQSGPPQ